MLTKQASDNTSCSMTPTTQYAPSEASIEWSVVTASAADFLSAVSDYDEKNVHGKLAQNAVLVVCWRARLTAVRVAKSAYRTGEKQIIKGLVRPWHLGILKSREDTPLSTLQGHYCLFHCVWTDAE